MWHFRRIFSLEKFKSIGIETNRFHSNRRTRKHSSNNDKHIIHQIQQMKLDENYLSPVVRQYLEKNPSYATRFGGKLSSDKKCLVRQYSRTTGRAERLFSKIPKDDLIWSINEDDKDVPRPPILSFPSADNQYQFDLGTEDPNVVQDKNVHCFGCGAILQCADRKRPGFTPSEIYRHYLSTDLQKRSSQCQRCFLLKSTEKISKCEVDEQIYQNILKEIRRKRALIILIVDLLDIPNSISQSWSHLIDRTSSETNHSSNIIFVLGNKLDLLPKDNKNYLSDILHCLQNECQKRGLGKHIVKYYGLISARTGYGIEELISKIFRYWSQHGGVYLLGGTNVGKTSLFNSLIDSDLCHIHALDCIQRATVSNLPGTTLNVLSFPIQLRTGKNQFMRTERLKEMKENQIESNDPFENETNQIEEIQSTVKWRRIVESQMNLPKSGVSYSYSSGENSFREDQSFLSREQHYINYRQKKVRAFDPHSYRNEKWLYDTPGVILPEQMINKSSNQIELSYFDHQSIIIKPIVILLNVGQTILIGGIARIDIKHITDKAQATLSLMTNTKLPINCIPTDRVELFYKQSLENNQLGVPQNRINGHLQDPPELSGPTIEIVGVGEEEAAADIVLSSAGWISVQCSVDARVTLDVMTPNGLGIHLRQPALLKYLSRLRGSRIEGTPFFDKFISNQETKQKDDLFEERNDELQMIINEKIWKGEELKHRRRAKRT